MRSYPEYNEQISFVKWAKLATRIYPELNMIYCNHNTQKLTPTQAQRWSLLGGVKGCPDMFLPVARKGYNGLYLEFKKPDLKPKTSRGKGGMSPEQTKFAMQLRAEGYKVDVAYSWIEAKEYTEDYLKI